MQKILTTAIFLSVLFANTSSFWLLDSCIDERICACDNAKINCTCVTDKWNEETNASTSVSEVAIHPYTLLHHTLSFLGIYDCQRVTFKVLSLSSKPPEIIEINNVADLIFNSAVFVNLEADSVIRRLTIKNSHLDVLNEGTFSNVSTIETIELRNVTIGKSLPNSFHNVTNLRSLLIIDSKIDVISAKTFHNVWTVDTVLIINSTIHRIEPEAIVIGNIKEFHLSHSVIHRWMSRSLTLINVTGVTISDCEIWDLEDSSATIMLGTRLNFSNNVIRRVRKNALKSMMDSWEILFTNNIIEIADEESLDTLMMQFVDSNVSSKNQLINNSFPCDENMCWILQDFLEINGKNDVSENFVTNNNFCVNRTFSLTHFAVNTSECWHKLSPEKSINSGSTGKCPIALSIILILFLINL